jgi:hypothetical protein
MKSFFAFALVLLLLFCEYSHADEITFTNGTRMTADVVEYKQGHIKIRKQDGEFISGKIEQVDHIVFGEGAGNAIAGASAPSLKVLQQLEAGLASARKQLQAKPGHGAVLF